MWLFIVCAVGVSPDHYAAFDYYGILRYVREGTYRIDGASTRLTVLLYARYVYDV